MDDFPEHTLVVEGREAIQLTLVAADLAICLWNIREDLRMMEKHNNDQEKVEGLAAAREIVNGHLEELPVELDNIIK